MPTADYKPPTSAEELRKGHRLKRCDSARTSLAVLMLAMVAPAAIAHPDPVIIWQNGFESVDTCAWARTRPAVMCDPEMVFVPAGEFTMGSEYVDPGCFGCANDQRPVHVVDLSAYWIDRNDVTVDQFTACVSAHACRAPVPYSSVPTCNSGAPGRGAHPINCIDWYQGRDYCAWALKRYPTEAEWEKAARGTDARTYPWGELSPTCNYAVISDPEAGGPGCGSGMTWPVGSKPAGISPYGAFDMDGNVAQWLNDWYSSGYYSVSPSTDPIGPATGTLNVLRGSSSGSTGGTLRSPHRGSVDPHSVSVSYGFRCARDPG